MKVCVEKVFIEGIFNSFKDIDANICGCYVKGLKYYQAAFLREEFCQDKVESGEYNFY